MTRKLLAALAALWSLPAAAQVYNNTLPVTCISAGNCIAATPVSNPDGTAIGAGGGGSVPTGTAGTPNASVVTVQGITGGTPQPISATALPLPTGAATSAGQPAVATAGSAAPTTGTQILGTDGTLARAVKVDVSGTLSTYALGLNGLNSPPGGSPLQSGCVGSSSALTAVTSGNMQRSQCNLVGGTAVSFGTSYTDLATYVAPQAAFDFGGVQRPPLFVPGYRDTVANQRVEARGDQSGAFVKEQARSQYFAETTTPLGANGVYTTAGSGRDSGATNPNPWSSFSCLGVSDQAGVSLRLQGSDDTTTWTTIQAVTPAASIVYTITAKLFYRYNRCSWTNGATAQGTLTVRSGYSAN